MVYHNSIMYLSEKNKSYFLQFFDCSRWYFKVY